ncbi:MAG: hypothetical protein HY403_09065 [Elusimicrobia bacterium]|nr:hypothetical protein [Elusimicrobiota bacterium]
MARRLPRTVVLGTGLFLSGAVSALGASVPTAAPRAGTPVPAAGGFAASPGVLVGAIEFSLRSVQSPSLPSLAPAPQGLSQANWDKLLLIVERARGAAVSRPARPELVLGAVSDDQALAALRAADAVLEGIAPESLENPQELGAAHERLWDGLRSAAAGTVVPASVSRGGGLSRPSARAGKAEAPAIAAPSAAAPRRDSRRRWEANREAILGEVESLRSRLAHDAGRRLEEIGAEAFERELDKSKISVREPGLGKAVMTKVDQSRMIRVVHAPTELAFIFVDADAVPRDSRHLRQVIGRQFFDAGEDRADGRRGRSVVVAWRRDGQIDSLEFHGKPRLWSRAWWRSYWDATYKTPARGDVVFGVLMGGIQGALALGLGAVKLAMLGTPLMLAPVFFTMGFGLAIGVFISTYKNWTYRGRRVSQFLKAATISLAFAYPVVIFTQGLGAVALTGAGLLTHAHVLSNVALNNVGKVAWQQIPAMGEKYRLLTGTLFWDIKKAAAVNQGFYLINWTLRLGDLLDIPGGKLIFLAGLPLAMAISYWYARKHGFSEAEEMRGLPARLGRRGTDAVRRIIGWKR